MRVAYLVSRFPHFSETFIVRELDEVAASGIEVELLSLFPARDGAPHEAAARWVPRVRRPGPGPAAAATARWLLRAPLRVAGAVGTIVAAHRRSPRILLRALATVPLALEHATTVRRLGVERVHAHYATYPALAAWVIRRVTGIPYSFTAHAHDIYVDRSMLARKVRDAQSVVTISAFNRALLEAERGVGGPPVEVVHCGVDVEQIAFRSRRLPTEGPVAALCVASMQEYKGHAVLLEALAGRGPVTRLVVDLVGDGHLRPALEAQAARLGLSERVRFRGVLSEGAVAACLAEADVFVLPSVIARDGQMEGIPVALMEAMAAGVPVVGTRLSGIPELVRDGETGLLAEPGDAAALRGVLEALLSDPDAAAERARAARSLVEREFTLAGQGAAMAALLGQAASS